MKWINVKNRLPKKSGDYLIFYTSMPDDPVMDIVWYSILYGWDRDKLWEEMIIYWMPLPDPPEEEVDCEQTFAPDSHNCAPCKHYGECVTREYFDHLD